MNDYILTDEAKAILQAIDDPQDKRPIFVFGRAGTGKTRLIHHYVEKTERNVVVLAPTGVAALNVKGETLHRFLRLPPAIIDEFVTHELPAGHAIHEVEVVIVDEVSMVRADLIDGLDRQLQVNLGKSEPFGGAQVVFVGDLGQLPPVVTDEDRQVLAFKYPNGEWCHLAQAFRRLRTESPKARPLFLTQVFRQTELQFLDLLNTLRLGYLADHHYDLLDTRVLPGVSEGDEQCLTLCTTNKRADAINQEHLSRLTSPEFQMRGLKTGQVPQGSRGDQLPTEEALTLKAGAQVMFVANDPEGRWVNGSLGEVVGRMEIKEEAEEGEDAQTISGVGVRLNGEVIGVAPYKWEFIAHTLEAPAPGVLRTVGLPKEKPKIKRQVVGTFTQIPLRLAWALTIHKAQGVTVDRVHVDLGRGAFASGQTYVALSRCRTLEGITLERRVRPQDVIVDPLVVPFLEPRPDA